jgi:hypothetical protein
LFTSVGIKVGFTVGSNVGSTVGLNVGSAVGLNVGACVGSAVGFVVGSDVGADVLKQCLSLLGSSTKPSRHSHKHVGPTFTAIVVVVSQP